ncbi:MAG: DNA polymerase III subunit delta [SAR202 cluster bacterium]|nr:DNA polymerase III subunit delta [SAR202 cluster bacterium]
MIYVLYGIDDFSIRQELSEIQNSIMQDDIFNTNVTKFYASSSTLAQIKEVCSTLPFMASKRLVILEGLLSLFDNKIVNGEVTKQDSWISFDSYVKEMPETTDLILIDGNINDRNKLLRQLVGTASIKPFPPIRGNNLINWINHKAKLEGCTISVPAVKLLASVVGSNLWIMDGEINKLSLYCSYKHITVEDVSTVVSDLFSREVRIFDAIDSIFLGNNPEFLKVIQKLQNEGMMTSQVVTMFARQLRLLLLAKHLHGKGVKVGALDKLSSYTNNRWVAQKILDQSRKYPEDVLRNIHTAFIDVDYLFKSESISQDSLGKIMIETMASSQRR